MIDIQKLIVQFIAMNNLKMKLENNFIYYSFKKNKIFNK